MFWTGYYYWTIMSRYTCSIFSSCIKSLMLLLSILSDISVTVIRTSMLLDFSKCVSYSTSIKIIWDAFYKFKLQGPILALLSQNLWWLDKRICYLISSLDDYYACKSLGEMLFWRYAVIFHSASSLPSSQSTLWIHVPGNNLLCVQVLFN